MNEPARRSKPSDIARDPRGCCRIAIRSCWSTASIDIRGDEFGVGIKNVTVNEPHFQGHFPGNPVMPGVLLLEGMAQTAGALCVRSTPGQDKPPARSIS